MTPTYLNCGDHSWIPNNSFELGKRSNPFLLLKGHKVPQCPIEELADASQGSKLQRCWRWAPGAVLCPSPLDLQERIIPMCWQPCCGRMSGTLIVGWLGSLQNATTLNLVFSIFASPYFRICLTNSIEKAEEQAWRRCDTGKNIWRRLASVKHYSIHQMWVTAKAVIYFKSAQ